MATSVILFRSGACFRPCVDGHSRSNGMIRAPPKRCLVMPRATPKNTPTPLAETKGVIQPETKRDINEKDIEEREKTETPKVFGDSPAGMFFRPESERRPELGNKNFLSMMKFDGPAPETINSRLAMVGIVWALLAEIVTGQSLVNQVSEGNGLMWFLLVVPVFVWATFVPLFGHGESPDSRGIGPFNAKAERWNGRAAMIGFVSLILTEQLFVKGPLLGFLNH